MLVKQIAVKRPSATCTPVAAQEASVSIKISLSPDCEQGASARRWCELKEQRRGQMETIKCYRREKWRNLKQYMFFFLNKMLFSWPKNSLYVKGCVRLTLTDRSPAPSKGSLVFFCLLSAQSSIAAVEKTPTKAVLHVYLCSVQPVLTQQQQPGQWPCTSMFEKYSSSVVV